MGLVDLFNVLKVRKLILLWATVVGLGVGIALALLLPTKYASIATVQVDSIQRNPLTGLAEPRFKVAEFLGQQSAIAGSRTVALEVINELSADGFIVMSDFEERWRKETGGELIAGNDARLWAADQILKDLTVTATEIGSTIDIAFQAEDPAQAARVANAFASAYMAIVLDHKQQRFASKAANFSDETRALAKDVADAQSELAAFREKSGMLPIGAQKIEAREVEFSALTQRLAEARADAAEAETLLRQAEATPRHALVNFPLPPDALAANQAQLRLSEVVAVLGRIRERLGEKYPDYVDGAKERAALETQIMTAIRDRANYATRRAAALEREASLLKEALTQMQKTRETYELLESRVAASQETYNLVTTRSHEEALQSRVDSIDVILLARATPPSKPATPPAWLVALVGLFAGAAIGVASAVFAELYEGRVRRAEIIKRIFRTGLVVEIAALTPPQTRRARRAKPAKSARAPMEMVA